MVQRMRRVSNSMLMRFNGVASMNIFILHEDPIISAQMLDDMRVVKMIVESYQQLVSAVRRHGALDEDLPLTKDGKPMKGGHHHHPCTRWTGDSRANYLYLCQYADALCDEYAKRFGKEHRGKQIVNHLIQCASMIPDGELTPFVQAMPHQFQSDDVVQSYRIFVRHKPRHRWVRASPPDWWDEIEVNGFLAAILDPSSRVYYNRGG